MNYVIRCLRCGDPMIEHEDSKITLDEGTVAESMDECLNCGYCRIFSYGTWHDEEIDITGGDVMATKLIGAYDHLNKDSHMELTVSICTVVELIRRMNFGEHRFLSELVRQRKSDPLYVNCSEFKKHTDAMEALLNDGYY